MDPAPWRRIENQPESLVGKLRRPVSLLEEFLIPTDVARRYVELACAFSWSEGVTGTSSLRIASKVTNALCAHVTPECFRIPGQNLPPPQSPEFRQLLHEILARYLRDFGQDLNPLDDALCPVPDLLARIRIGEWP